MRTLFIDTETTGLPKRRMVPSSPHYPEIAEFAWILEDVDGQVSSEGSLLVRTSYMSPGAEKVHGLSESYLRSHGVDPATLLALIVDLLRKSDCVVAHNLGFDAPLIEALYWAEGQENLLQEWSSIQGFCTMRRSTYVVNLPEPWEGAGPKWPTLAEAHLCLTGESLENAHRAHADVRACRRVYHALRRRGAELSETSRLSSFSEAFCWLERYREEWELRIQFGEHCEAVVEFENLLVPEHERTFKCFERLALRFWRNWVPGEGNVFDDLLSDFTFVECYGKAPMLYVSWYIAEYYDHHIHYCEPERIEGCFLLRDLLVERALGRLHEHRCKDSSFERHPVSLPLGDMADAYLEDLQANDADPSMLQVVQGMERLVSDALEAEFPLDGGRSNAVGPDEHRAG